MPAASGSSPLMQTAWFLFLAAWRSGTWPIFPPYPISQAVVCSFSPREAPFNTKQSRGGRALARRQHDYNLLGL